ncbi:MAG TPA: class I SAM-dependent methyltransferase [Streptosporangiaceae bacterium]|nr:class I SAM-dependent methyltransferase [Streptosporangiaceae bacterium]
MSAHDRSRFSYKFSYALRHPGRVFPYARRRGRSAVIGMKSRDHISYYRAVMKSDAARGHEAAVGSKTHDSWVKLGQLQFEYLVKHGLQPGDRMLEIGCGDLRAGRLFIDYLDPGNYYGIDISPDILLAAQDTVEEYQLQDKLPHLAVVRDLQFRFLPADQFTVVHAHGVFPHSPIEVIDECLANVGRVMRPHGVFDFTFDRTEGPEHQLLRENFYYQTQTLLELAAARGLDAEFMQDWADLPHHQSKIRVTRRA